MKIIYSAIFVLAGISVLAVLVVLGRQALRRVMTKKLLKQSSEVRVLLREMRERNYVGINKMLFDMRDSYDLSVIEDELHVVLKTGSDTSSENLREAFDLLGLTGHYLGRLRNGKGWQERARCATALGQLGDARAVEPLVAAMRDKREDSDVKLAAAEALGRIQDPAIVPVLCEQLADIDEWASPRLAQVITSYGSVAVDALLATMDSAVSLNARIWSAQVLGKIRDRRATPALIMRLHDRSEQMRISVASALGDIGDNRAFRPLIEVILRDPVAAVRTQVAGALGRIGEEGALPVLVAALGDPDYWTRFRALEAIEALGARDTEPIEVALGDTNPEVRKRAALALERLGVLEQVFEDLGSSDPLVETAARARLIAVGRAGLSERLARHLDDGDVFMRERIASLLGSLGDPKHAYDLVACLEDESEVVRFAAMESLGDLGVANTVQKLVSFLTHVDSLHRSEAVKALVRYPHETLQTEEDRLMELMQEESDQVRLAALRVLAFVEGKDVIGVLKSALQDRNIEVRLVAVTALGNRVVDDAIPELGRCLNDPNNRLRTAAAASLGKIGGSRALDLLLAVMPNTSGEQRDSICETLAALGFAAIGPLLDVLMASTEQKNRMGAIWTLGKTGDVRATEFLRLFLLEEDVALRASAAGALGKIACGESIDALSKAISDPDSHVRAAAVNGLGRIGAGVPIDILRLATEDPDLFVRNRAAIAIGRIGGDAAHEMIVSVADEQLEPAIRVIALGLTGSPTGVGIPLQSMKDEKLRDKVSTILQEEDEAVQVIFFANLTPGGYRNLERRVAHSGTSLEPSELLERFVSAVRSSRDPETRQRAAEALSGMVDDKAIVALGQALACDPEVRVRVSAARGLARHPKVQKSLAALLSSICDPHPEVRRVAIEAAGMYASPTDAQEIFDSLGSSEPGLVEVSEIALAKIHADDVERVHNWLAKQENPALQAAGLRILARIGDASSFDHIVAWLRAEQPSVRIESARALAALEISEAIHVILEALADPLEEVRVGIVAALAGNTRSDVLDTLTSCCLDPSVLVRRELVHAVKACAMPQALAILSTLAQDANPVVSSTALLALLEGAVPGGQCRFLELFMSASFSAKKMIREGAKLKLCSIKEQVRADLNSEARQRGVQILSAIDSVGFADDIAEAIRDPNADVRLCAVNTLGLLEREQVGDWLRYLLEDPVGDVRAAARRALLRGV